jgi:hypothetical protein
MGVVFVRILCKLTYWAGNMHSVSEELSEGTVAFDKESTSACELG